MFCKVRGFFLVLMVSLPIEAKNMGVVNSVSGRVFGTLGKKTKTLRIGDTLENFSEILTEEGGKVSFSDYFDGSYTLAGSGHLQFEEGILRLKRGYLHIHSRQKNREFILETANARAVYKGGEAIASFDDEQRKTQLLVTKGRFYFGGLLEKLINVEIGEGYFSSVQKDSNQGRPQVPMLIGLQSLKKALALFNYQERSLASLSPPDPDGVRRGMPPSPEYREKKKQLVSFYHNRLAGMRKKQKKFRPSYRKKTSVVINVFGRELKRFPASSKKEDIPKKKKLSARRPASIMGQPLETDPFESVLMKQYKKQMRHPPEVNALIDALKSYKSDYSKTH